MFTNKVRGRHAVVTDQYWVHYLFNERRDKSSSTYDNILEEHWADEILLLHPNPVENSCPVRILIMCQETALEASRRRVADVFK